MRPQYIVSWLVSTGVIMRDGPGGYQAVAYLHCTEAEAREIASDLGVELRHGSYHVMNHNGETYHHVEQECPLDCNHNDYWK